jgi:hypothetical protein
MRFSGMSFCSLPYPFKLPSDPHHSMERENVNPGKRIGGRERN